MAKNPHLRLENRIAVTREYADLWQQFFQYFTEEWEEIEVSEEMERQFEQLVNVLSLNHYKFEQLAGEFMKDTGGVVKLLAGVVNLQNIKEMQEATRGKMMVEAHTLLIDMHKALGKMLAQMSPKQLQAMQAAQEGGGVPA